MRKIVEEDRLIAIVREVLQVIFQFGRADKEVGIAPRFVADGVVHQDGDIDIRRGQICVLGARKIENAVLCLPHEQPKSLRRADAVDPEFPILPERLCPVRREPQARAHAAEHRRVLGFLQD